MCRRNLCFDLFGDNKVNFERFQKVLETRIEHMRETLSTKSAEYSSDSDKLENFKDAAAMLNTTPEYALWGMVTKHIIALQKFIHQLYSDEIVAVNYAQWDEKIGDIICYMVLLDALIQERQNEDKD
jgi:hypothetical protein